MSSVVQSPLSEVNLASPSHLLLNHRQKLVEDLWESVLRSECGQEMVDLLKQMRTLSSPEGQVTEEPTASVTQIIANLAIEDAIQAARAFALYFQLINIVEQHYERREQKLARRVSHDKLESKLNGNGNGKAITTSNSRFFARVSEVRIDSSYRQFTRPSTVAMRL